MRLRSNSAMAPMMTTMALPRGPAGINIFPKADELDIIMVEFVEHFEEVPGGAGDPIEGPDQDDLELAAAGIGQQLIETRALCFRAADPVSVFVNDLETALRGQRAQIVHLGLRMLVQGGNAEVDGGPLQLAPGFLLRSNAILRYILMDKLQ